MSSGQDFTETGLKSEDRLMSSLFPHLLTVALNVLHAVLLHGHWATLFNRPHRRRTRVELEIMINDGDDDYFVTRDIAYQARALFT